jgi:Na+-driven multidrug efflux pump
MLKVVGFIVIVALAVLFQAYQHLGLLGVAIDLGAALVVSAIVAIVSLIGRRREAHEAQFDLTDA